MSTAIDDAGVEDLDRLVPALSLPADTRARVHTSSLEPLGEFPLSDRN